MFTLFCFSSFSRSVIPEGIYGTDDREEVENSYSKYQELAGAVAAQMRYSLLEDGGDNYILEAYTLEKKRNVCSDVRFSKQPAAASCTGFLVGKDILVTAGHCMISRSSCTRKGWVFNYQTSCGKFDNLIPKKDVYKCKELITSEYTGRDGLDYAIVRLDRAVDGAIPLKIRRRGRVKPGSDLLVIGHPDGLPQKIALNAWVRNYQAGLDKNLFFANLDTFKNNSGSPVINADTGLVEGILVNGGNDYGEYDDVNECKRISVCRDDECSGEGVVRINRVKPLIKLLSKVPI